MASNLGYRSPHLIVIAATGKLRLVERPLESAHLLLVAVQLTKVWFGRAHIAQQNRLVAAMNTGRETRGLARGSVSENTVHKMSFAAERKHMRKYNNLSSKLRYRDPDASVDEVHAIELTRPK